MKTITCREVGFNCDYVVKSEAEEEIMKKCWRTCDKRRGYYSRIQGKSKRTYSHYLKTHS
jgi:Protein of unknown function (DUF1059)